MMGAVGQENRSGWAWVTWRMRRFQRRRRWSRREAVSRGKEEAVVSQTTNDDALKRSDSTSGDNKRYIYMCVKTRGGQQGLCVQGRRVEVEGRGWRTKLIGVCVCVRGGTRTKKLGGQEGGGLYFYRSNQGGVHGHGSQCGRRYKYRYVRGYLRGGHSCGSQCVRHCEHGVVRGCLRGDHGWGSQWVRHDEYGLTSVCLRGGHGHGSQCGRYYACRFVSGCLRGGHSWGSQCFRHCEYGLVSGCLRGGHGCGSQCV